MSGRYEVARFEPAYLDGIAELQTHLWNPSREVNRAYFRWKYEQNPYITRPHVYVALHEGRVVAMRGFFGSQWSAGVSDDPVTLACAGDLTIAPDHRGQGLFRTVMDIGLAGVALDRLPFAFNFSGGGATRHLSLQSGWASTASIERMIWRRPAVGWVSRNVSAIVGKVTHGARQPLDANAFDEFDRAAAKAGGAGEIRLGSSLGSDQMAALVTRRARDARMRHVRDRRYFDWRLRNPRSTYRFVSAGGDQLDAYIVLQARAGAGAGRTVHIVDWQSDNDLMGRSLIATALGAGRFAAVDVWSASLSATQRRDLRELGFVPEPTVTSSTDISAVLVRPTDATPPKQPWRFHGIDLLDLTQWDLTLLESDIS